MVVLHDIYIESPDGLNAQIDFIVVTSKVIFLIECKNLFGNIDIDSNGTFIRTITYNNKKIKEGIYSPITQNERHMSILKEARAANTNWLKSFSIRHNFDSFYKPLVVLSNPKTILNDRFAKKEVKNKVIRADQLIATMRQMISESKEFPSSKKEMLSIAQSLLDMNISERKNYSSKYEELIKESQNQATLPTTSSSPEPPVEDSLVCPKCGAKLVLRTAKKGDHVGKKFYGCSAFPKCRYVKNLV